MKDHHKPPPGIAADLRRLRHARAVLHAVEQRTRAHRDGRTDNAADVAKRLAANHGVRIAVGKFIDGGPHE
ncbi:hypothetical protein B0G81_3975 [Paraburkholderia sp. BL6665CI2N2]|uniref:hypothetical protein n=1 Tax=Paraburkholderia sp. BL6665CI2N2 TaxID=1938806 RepID=UPI0010D544B7|nr:hypothetical protein [Paraburkholderia sp. BL6665CI2N2]TDY23592.1 hypothetical protein B0G81_3975 [Paraburkholderia sp. BL6665CI2N2]